jgi:ubiquitin-protein ligase
VTLGGSICMLPLTDEGWNPGFDIESIIEMVRANILDPSSKARINLDASGDYSMQEAKEAFQRLVQTHGWKHRF